VDALVCFPYLAKIAQIPKCRDRFQNTIKVATAFLAAAEAKHKRYLFLDAALEKD
jgi:hypothetical protein